MSNKEKWFAVSGTWVKNYPDKTETALRMKVYDDVNSSAEALGKYIEDVTKGPDNVDGFNLMLWRTCTFLVPKEAATIDPTFEKGMMEGH